MTMPTQPPSGRPSGRRRRTGGLIGAGLLVLPVLEIALAIQVGLRIGAGWTLLALLAGSAAGLFVLRHVGLSAVRRLATPPGAAGSARSPRPPAQTALVVLAGVLLLIPGFLTDVGGLVLLLPGVRRLLARRAEAALVRRFDVRGIQVMQGQVIQGQVIGDGERIADHVDVQVVQVRDIDPPALPGGGGRV
jgi:UPF0716 protein FxsA